MTDPSRVTARRLTLAILVLATAACENAPPSAPATPRATATKTPDVATRPASPVTVRIVEPVNGAVIQGTTMHVVIAIDGGTIVKVTTSQIHPDQGHVHLYLDNNLVLMNYTLEQDVPVHAGENGTLRAEFVAGDHAPFNPRVTTPDVFFSVQR